MFSVPCLPRHAQRNAAVAYVREDMNPPTPGPFQNNINKFIQRETSWGVAAQAQPTKGGGREKKIKQVLEPKWRQHAAPQIRVQPRATCQGHVQRSRVVTQWDNECNTRDCACGHLGYNLVQHSYPFIGLMFGRSLTTGDLPLLHVKACWPHITCGLLWSETKDNKL